MGNCLQKISSSHNQTDVKIYRTPMHSEDSLNRVWRPISRVDEGMFYTSETLQIVLDGRLG
jgi:hypothetical protein